MQRNTKQNNENPLNSIPQGHSRGFLAVGIQILINATAQGPAPITTQTQNETVPSLKSFLYKYTRRGVKTPGGYRKPHQHRDRMMPAAQCRTAAAAMPLMLSELLPPGSSQPALPTFALLAKSHPNPSASQPLRDLSPAPNSPSCGAGAV